MSTDRELLELAAKAAGIKGTWNERGQCLHITDQGFQSDVWWRPHLDDGDALRLAGELLLSVSIDAGYTVVIDQNERTTYETAHGLVATRRAIVRAAAEIGRAMP